MNKNSKVTNRKMKSFRLPNDIIHKLEMLSGLWGVSTTRVIETCVDRQFEVAIFPYTESESE